MAKRRPKRKPPWPENLAKYSWASAILALTMPCLLGLVVNGGANPNNPQPDDLARLAPGILYLLLALSGIGCGIAALIGMSAHGTKRIMAPAIVGIVLHLLVFGFYIITAVAAAAALQQA